MLPIVATIIFVIAVLHTFATSFFQGLARKYPQGSVPEKTFHLLGEVEFAFGLWGCVFLAVIFISQGLESLSAYLGNRSFVEPFFVFVVLSICSTKPILELAKSFIQMAALRVPMNRVIATYLVTLIVGPLLGSLITEPAAMTVTALLLLENFFSSSTSSKFKYVTLAVLFVNISIGGTITPFAAPPVLMVASTWGWDLSFMLNEFAWRAVLGCVSTTGIAVIVLKKELQLLVLKSQASAKIPFWILLLHVFALAIVVGFHQYPAICALVFILFLLLFRQTKSYQDDIKIKSGIMVAFFLAGIVVLGEPQKWWLEPLISQLAAFPLYACSILLTSITDNAALTYLGSQISGLDTSLRFALVAGAVVGGGLTVIANAPNPIGYGLLNASFGKDGIRAKNLFLTAVPFTLVVAVIFWI